MLAIIVSDFGTWLRAHRLRTGLSLRQLETRINKLVTFAYLDQLEKGVRGKKGKPARPSLELVDALAKVFGVSIDEARLAAGYAPHSFPGNPQNMKEFLEALDRLGVPGLELVGAYHGIETFTSEDFQKLLADIKLVVELTVQRKIQ